MESKKIIKITLLLMSLLFLFIIYSCFFQLGAQQGAILTRFERPTATLAEGGIYFKYPWPIERVYFIDRMLQNYQTPEHEISTQDGKILIVSAYLQWRPSNLEKYQAKIGTLKSDATAQLALIYQNQLKFAFGKINYHDLFTQDKGLASLNETLFKSMQLICQNELGIEIALAGVNDVKLTASAQQALLQRQIAIYQKEAATVLERARQDAAKAEQQASVKSNEMWSQADTKAAEIISQTDDQVAQLYDIYNKNKNFSRFIWKLRASEESLRSQTTLILDQSYSLLNVFNVDSEKQ